VCCFATVHAIALLQAKARFSHKCHEAMARAFVMAKDAISISTGWMPGIGDYGEGDWHHRRSVGHNSAARLSVKRLSRMPS
jgi:hypothetical protein